MTRLEWIVTLGIGIPGAFLGLVAFGYALEQLVGT